MIFPLPTSRGTIERPGGWRRRVAVGSCLLLLAVAGGGGAVAWWGLAMPEPPATVLTDADPRISRALNEARAAVRRSPRSAQAWGELGMTFAANDCAQDACTCFAQAERLDPKDPRWPYLRGLQLASRDLNAAVGEYERGAALAPATVPGPRLRLGEALLTLGRTEDAEVQFREIITQDSGNANALLDLARVAQLRGDGAKALAYLDNAVGNPHVRKAALVLRAQISQSLGRGAEALRALQEAGQAPDDEPWPDLYRAELEQHRTGMQAAVARAVHLRDAGQVDQALALLRDTVEAYPDAAYAWTTLGRTHVGLGDYPRAEAAFRRAVQAAPDLGEARFYLGVAAFAQGKYGPAAECFRMAGELEPQHPLARYNLGQALLRQGDRAGAIDAFRAALRYRPELAEAHRALGALLAEAGGREEALAQLRQAVDLDPADAEAKRLLEQVQRESRR
jgi:tetratricopeptide (TPR) repeat protein